MTPTVMWEAKAAHDRAVELLEWALRTAPHDADVYRAPDGRVVVVDRTGAGLPDAPADLLARPVHVWRFEPVERA